MECAHHVAEALNAFWPKVARGWCKEAKRVVSPEVFQPAIQQMLIVREPVDRQQLYRRNAEIFDVVHSRFMAHPLEVTAQRLRQRRVKLGKPLHMGFIDNRLRPRNSGPIVILPVKLIGVNDPALRHKRRAVAFIKGQILILVQHVVCEMGFVPLHVAYQLTSIGIDNQLVGVKAVTVFRIERTVHAETIQCPRLQTRHVAMPDFMGVFWQVHAADFMLAAGVIKAKLNALCMRREKGKIDTLTIVVCAEKVIIPRQDLVGIMVFHSFFSIECGLQRAHSFRQ